MKFAIQMYTLRHHINSPEDMLRVLGDVKNLGFDGVEFAGFADVPADTLRRRLDELGLVCVGAHMSLDDFTEENLSETLETAKTLGTTCIGIGGANTETEEALSHVIGVMRRAHTAAAKEGIHVYFHNHTSEFQPPLFAEKPGTIFDRLKEVCDMQVDTYWSFAAGQDNEKLIAENKDRIVLLHIKDGVGHDTMALGEGENDLGAVVKAAKDNGFDWLILENDDPKPTGLEDAARSMAWLNANAR